MLGFTHTSAYHRSLKMFSAQSVVLVELIWSFIFQICPSTVLHPSLTSASKQKEKKLAFSLNKIPFNFKTYNWSAAIPALHAGLRKALCTFSWKVPWRLFKNLLFSFCSPFNNEVMNLFPLAFVSYIQHGNAIAHEAQPSNSEQELYSKKS